MRTIRTLFAIAFILALPVAAQQITFDPPLPNSDQPVKARIYLLWPNGCQVAEPQVTLVGGDIIRIELTERDAPCLSGPLDHVLNVNLGYLVATLYRVEIVVNGTLYRTAGLRVTEAFPPFTMTLDAAPERGGYDVSFIVPNDLCVDPTCGPVTVKFGETEATNLRRADGNNRITVTVPPHPAGSVSVTVANDHRSVTAWRAFAYFSESAPPDFGLFEPVLFPLLARGPGAGGSQWDTDAILVSHSSERPLITQYPLETPPPIASQRHFQVTGERMWPRGMIWLPLRGTTPTASAALTVRETSRGHAFELPTVREGDFAQYHTIAGLPRSGGSRMLLRVYSLDDPYPGAPHRVSVNLSGLTTYIPRGAAELALTRTRNDEPWYGSLDLGTIHLDTLGVPDRDEQLKVVVSGWPHRIWAFVSIVDNQTQATRLVTPVR